MKSDKVFLDCEVDEKTGTLFVHPFKQDKIRRYVIDPSDVSENFVLKKVEGMPTEINGSLSFNFSEEFILGFKAESFIGFPKLITEYLDIGCLSSSFRGLENTECLKLARLRVSHLKDFTYFPRIGKAGMFKLIFGAKPSELLLNDIVSTYRSDFCLFVEEYLNVPDFSREIKSLKQAGSLTREVLYSLTANVRAKGIAGSKGLLEHFLNFKFEAKSKVDSILDSL